MAPDHHAQIPGVELWKARKDVDQEGDAERNNCQPCCEEYAIFVPFSRYESVIEDAEH